MSLKQTSKILEGGSLFCYRGISGLSNETIGSAFYKYTGDNAGTHRGLRVAYIDPHHIQSYFTNLSINCYSETQFRLHCCAVVIPNWSYILCYFLTTAKNSYMQTIKYTLAITIAYYSPILIRYANFFLKDMALSEKLVQQVLEDQYEIDRLTESPTLRLDLKTNLHYWCRYYQLSHQFSKAPIKASQN